MGLRQRVGVAVHQQQARAFAREQHRRGLAIAPAVAAAGAGDDRNALVQTAAHCAGPASVPDASRACTRQAVGVMPVWLRNTRLKNPRSP
ncbi:MAG: hypothetical protein JWQ90_490 [Hydrocarboniphaga sp.]|nr:hypothetical protein [Hydrocarboniphaga sp.]